MEPIRLTKYSPELSAQLSYLIGLEFSYLYKKYRRELRVIVMYSILYLCLMLATERYSLLNLKVVFSIITALVWLSLLIAGIVIFIRYFKRISWRNRSVAEAAEKLEYFSLHFDDDGIYFTTTKYKTEINWEYYKYWSEYNNSIFILNETNIYEALYYSERALGKVEFACLRQIVESKLIKLNK